MPTNTSHGSGVSPSGRRNDAMAIRATPWLPRASDSRPTGTLRARGVQAEQEHPKQPQGPSIKDEPRERSVPVGQTKRRHGHQGNALVASRFRFAPDGDTALPGRPGRSRAPGEAPISTNPMSNMSHGSGVSPSGRRNDAMAIRAAPWLPRASDSRPTGTLHARGVQADPKTPRRGAPQYRTATSVSPCGGAVMPASLRGAPSSSARNDSVSRRPRPHSSMVPTTTRTM